MYVCRKEECIYEKSNPHELQKNTLGSFENIYEFKKNYVNIYRLAVLYSSIQLFVFYFRLSFKMLNGVRNNS